MLMAERVARKSSQTASPLRAASTATHATGAARVGMSNQAMQRLLRTGTIQAKLMVNEPGDRFEQEADRTADAVLQMPAPRSRPVTPVSGLAHPLQVQRMCAACEEEEKVQRKCSECEKEEIHRKSAEPPDRTPEVTRDVQNRIDAVRSGGEPLPRSVRDDFEPRFGHDFSQVRIHTDPQASESARAVRAMAFTLGHHIVFDAGKYEPTTTAGRHLLAHELTHTLQQEGGSRTAPTAIQRQAEGSGTAPSNACASAEKGFSRVPPEPTCPRPTHRGSRELARFRFCLDSNQPVDPEGLDAELDAILQKEPRSTRFLVHGHASSDGDAEGNFRLSCHRANRVAEALRGKGVTADRIETGSRGPTGEFSGGLEANRVVVVYGQEVGRFGEDLDDPSCEDAPRKIGDVKPEIDCDEPTIDLTRRGEGPHLKHFHFCLDSDVLTDESVADIRSFAFSQAARTSFVIHGFASTEGTDAYNKVLSCNRALRIMRELLNLRVRPLQIREVSGLGEFAGFGDAEFSRVAVVLAEDGEISPTVEPARSPQNVQQKRALLNDALTRLIGGHYKLAADSYISYWTCGRTPSLAHAVHRLKVSLQEEAGVSGLPDGDREEAQVMNSAILADRDLRAPNPLECVQTRLVDIAFHHAVVNNAGLPVDLVVANRPEARHDAGRHLAHLAGFSKCQGNFDRQGSRDDQPLTTDPRATLAPPACAEAPQQTRLLPPGQGASTRKPPQFTGTPDFLPNSGTIDFPGRAGGSGGGSRPTSVSSITRQSRDFLETQAPILTASATGIKLVGDPKVFADYEVGFVQTVLADMNVVEYVSGHRVIQQLPVPIRDAGNRVTPAPWMATTASRRPDADGNVPDFSAGIPFLNVTAPAFLHFDPTSNLSGNLFDTWHRDTRIAIWLIARRLGAPLDRFSIHVIGGAVFDLSQDVRAVLRRVLDINDPLRFPRDVELLRREGEFRTVKIGDSAFDPRLAQLHGPVVRDIDLNRHVIRILEPAVAVQGQGMSFGEYAAVVRDILDTFLIFESPEETGDVSQGKPMPRLGFEFIPLTIKVPINKKTGRMALLNMSLGGPSVSVQAHIPSLGSEALNGIAGALSVRLRMRDPLRRGQNVVLRVPAQDGNGFVTDPSDPDTGTLTIFLPPRQGGKKEPDLLLQTDNHLKESVALQMAHMWACTQFTKQRSCSDGLNDPREFGAAYWIDRAGDLHRIFEDRFQVSKEEDPSSGVTEVDLVCGPGNHPSGFALGTVHTHPEQPDFSEADEAMIDAGRCGRQHFLVTQTEVRFKEPGKPSRPLGSRTSVLPSVTTCDSTNFLGAQPPICHRSGGLK